MKIITSLVLHDTDGNDIKNTIQNSHLIGKNSAASDEDRIEFFKQAFATVDRVLLRVANEAFNLGLMHGKEKQR